MTGSILQKELVPHCMAIWKSITAGDYIKLQTEVK